MEPGETVTSLLDDYAAAAKRTEEVIASLPDLDTAHKLPEAPWYPPDAAWNGARGAPAPPARDRPARRARRHHQGVPRRPLSRRNGCRRGARHGGCCAPRAEPRGRHRGVPPARAARAGRGRRDGAWCARPTAAEVGRFARVVGGRCEDRTMLFTEVVAASAAVGATRARTAKAATLAALLRAATPAEVEPVTAWLAGEARQGRIGTGWRTLSGHRRAARGRARRSPSRPSTPRSTRSPPPRARAPRSGGPSCCTACSPPPPARSSASSPRCSAASCATARWRA